MPNSSQNLNDRLNRSQFSSSSSLSVEALGEEFAKTFTFDQQEKSGIDAFVAASTNTFKSFNLDNFEPNNAVYRSVAVGSLDTKPGFEGFNDLSSACHTPAVFGEKGLTRAAVNSRVPKVNANALLWPFCEYPAAACHGFSSCDSLELQKGIEAACQSRDIDFALRKGEGLHYDCEVVINSYKARFSIAVSKLLSKCQKAIGHLYVVELIKDEFSCPCQWSELSSQLLKSLAPSVVEFNPKKEQQKPVFSEVFNVEQAKCQGRADTRKHELGSIGGNTLLNEFFSVVGQDTTETAVRFAEVFASVSPTISVHDDTEMLETGSIKKLVDLFNNGNVDLSRSVCTIVRSLAKSGWLDGVAVEEKTTLIKSLVRIVNIVGSGTSFTLQLKREAVQALAAMRKVFTPTDDFTVEMARRMLTSCSKSSDAQLSRLSREALRLFQFEVSA